MNDLILPDRGLHAMSASCYHTFVTASALVTGWHGEMFSTEHIAHAAASPQKCNHLDCRTCLIPEEDTYLMDQMAEYE